MVVLAVAICGALGALLRFGVNRVMGGEAFPYSTLLVNGVGSFLIGYTFFAFQGGGSLSWCPPWVKVGMTVGFWGALTTFSTFSLDSLKLFTAGAMGLGLLNLLANNFLCLSFCYLGWKVGQL